MAAISTKKTTQPKRLLCLGVQPLPLPLPFYMQFLTVKKSLSSTFYWQKKTSLHTKFRTLNPFGWTAVKAPCYIDEQKDRMYGGKVYIVGWLL